MKTEIQDNKTYLTLEAKDFSEGTEFTVGTYRKTAKISARQIQEDENGSVVDTVLANGHKETSNVATVGSWVVTNPGGEEYIVTNEKFSNLYEETEDEGIYKPKGRVRAFKNPFGFEAHMKTSWGEMTGDKDCYLVHNTVTDSFYLIGNKEFFETYERVED